MDITNRILLNSITVKVCLKIKLVKRIRVMVIFHKETLSIHADNPRINRVYQRNQYQ